MSRFAAVIFDLDGTLLDTLTDIAEAANQVLEMHGVRRHPVDSYRRFVGDGVAKLFVRSLPSDKCGAGDIRDYVRQFREAYARTWKQTTKPFAGIPELLDTLTVNNTPTAVLSNKPHESTQLCTQEFLSHHVFQMVLGYREGTPRKPDPSSALEIVEHLSVDPQSCAYLGDTPTDMQTSNAAGMYSVGVSWGFCPREELVDHGAQAILDHPLDLLPILGIEK